MGGSAVRCQHDSAAAERLRLRHVRLHVLRLPVRRPASRVQPGPHSCAAETNMPLPIGGKVAL